MSWTPQDLPYARDVSVRVLLEAAQLAAGMDLAQREREIRQMLREAGIKHPPAGSIPEVPHFAQVVGILDEAPLTWLDSDVSALVDEVADDLPEWTPAAALPAASGLIAFERPPARPWLPDGTKMLVRGVTWRVTGSTLEFAWLIDGTALPGISAPLLPLGVMDIALDEPLASSGAASVLGAAWLLMGQRRIVEDDAPVVMSVKQKGLARARWGARREVSISYKKLNDTYRPGAGAAARGRGRPAVKRWWVRGHWRQQAWGKGRKQRKPVFIAPHTAGAHGVEPEAPRHVQVWREGDIKNRPQPKGVEAMRVGVRGLVLSPPGESLSLAR